MYRFMSASNVKYCEPVIAGGGSTFLRAVIRAPSLLGDRLLRRVGSTLGLYSGTFGAGCKPVAHLALDPRDGVITEHDAAREVACVFEVANSPLGQPDDVEHC